jgi:hypothetical protein
VTEEKTKKIRMMVDVAKKMWRSQNRKSNDKQHIEFDNMTEAEIKTHRLISPPSSTDPSECDSFLQDKKYSRYRYMNIHRQHIGCCILIYIQYLAQEKGRVNFICLIYQSAYFVPESKRNWQLFRELQQKKIHIAVVIDEYWGRRNVNWKTWKKKSTATYSMKTRDRERKREARWNDLSDQWPNILDTFMDYVGVDLPLIDETLRGLLSSVWEEYGK